MVKADGGVRWLLFNQKAEQMCVIRACKVGDGGVPYQSWSPIFGGCRFVLLFIFNAVREKGFSLSQK